MKKSILAIAVLSSCIAGSAMAYSQPDVGGRYFVSPQFGMYFTDDKRHLENGGMFGLAGGYNVNNNITFQAIASDISTSPNGYYIRAEGLYNFPMTALPVVPYIAGGVGALKVNDSGMAVDGGFGFKYYVNNNVGVGIDYRHVWQVTTGLYNDNLLDVGITWTFGGTNWLGMPVSAAPAPAAQYQPQALTVSQQKAVAQAKQTLKYVLPQGVEQCGVNGATPQDGCITIAGNQVTMHLDIKFQQNVATIGGQFAPAIVRLATFMNTYPTTNATLYGYASSEGPLSFNQKLSLHRANQVKNYLVNKQSINVARIQTVGMGIQNPIADNKTNMGRQKNRRVEAAVTVPMQVQS